MKFVLLIIFMYPLSIFCQLSESLLNKIRNATDDYYIVQDTLAIVGSNTLPCLEVYVNGKGPYKFLIDLGSNVLIFKETVVRESNTKVLLDRLRNDIVKADQLKIGESIFFDVYAASYEKLDVDGVIGYNILRNSNFLINYPEMKFQFVGDLDHDIDSTYLKYVTISRMPYLKSKLGEKEILINFDTGADQWLYFPYHWKDSVTFETPLREYKMMSNNQTGRVMTYIGKIKENIHIGNYTITSPHIIFDPDIEDIYFGSSLLSEFKLFFYPEKELVKLNRASSGKEIIIPKPLN